MQNNVKAYYDEVMQQDWRKKHPRFYIQSSISGGGDKNQVWISLYSSPRDIEFLLKEIVYHYKRITKYDFDNIDDVIRKFNEEVGESE